MMNPFVEAKKAFTNSDWPKVLQSYGCTVRNLNTDIFQKPLPDMKHILEDVSYAYSQLSNLRVNKKTKEVKNKDDIQAARDNAIASYTALLKKDETNMKGLQGMAYIYYKAVIDASMQKNVSPVQDVSRLSNFKEAKTWYQRLLSVDEMNVKGNYRYGKLYATMLSSWSPSFQHYLQEQHMARRNAQNLSVVYFQKALMAYDTLSEKSKKEYFKYSVKAKYSLGNMYLSMCSDNSKKVWPTFEENPNQTVAGYVAYGSEKDLDQALEQYLNVLVDYGMDVDGPIDVSQYVASRKQGYAISPKDVLYRVGCVYTAQYQRQCFLYGRDKGDMGLVEKGVYYYLLSQQYAWWMMKKGYSRNEMYGYVNQKLTELCRLAGIAPQGEEVQKIQHDIPSYIPEPKKGV